MSQFTAYQNQPVKVTGDYMQIGNQRFARNASLDCGESLGVVPLEQIAQTMEHYVHLTHGEYNPQLAAIICAITKNSRALDFYFPIVGILVEAERTNFYQFIESLTQRPELDIQLITENRKQLSDSLRDDVAYIVAGHIAEIFFYRRDILESFLAKPKHIKLYTTQRAFQADGGQMGGDYDPRTESLQLVISRLVEGFFGPTPGVAPFLHEFGHMLDAFDAGTNRMNNGDGLYPGLNPKDGTIYSPKARELFIRGKRLELERYMLRYQNKAKPSDPLPIGHPYVFQNDGEFAAGYLEMFLRNPNYFAEQNVDLYQSYVELFGYDSRRAWKEDFPFYVSENRNFYLSGKQPWKPGITIPSK